MYELEVKRPDLASAVGISETSLTSRMTGRLPWGQDEMHRVCDYINSIAKDEGLSPPFPYEKIHEIFPPRQNVAAKKATKAVAARS